MSERKDIGKIRNNRNGNMLVLCDICVVDHYEKSDKYHKRYPRGWKKKR